MATGNNSLNLDPGGRPDRPLFVEVTTLPVMPVAGASLIGQTFDLATVDATGSEGPGFISTVTDACYNKHLFKTVLNGAGTFTSGDLLFKTTLDNGANWDVFRCCPALSSNDINGQLWDFDVPLNSVQVCLGTLQDFAGGTLEVLLRGNMCA